MARKKKKKNKRYTHLANSQNPEGCSESYRQLIVDSSNTDITKRKKAAGIQSVLSGSFFHATVTPGMLINDLLSISTAALGRCSVLIHKKKK